MPRYHNNNKLNVNIKMTSMYENTMTGEKPLDWKKIILIKYIKHKRAMSWFLHASISIQSMNIYHN
jgi:hypothetical protein